MTLTSDEVKSRLEARECRAPASADCAPAQDKIRGRVHFTNNNRLFFIQLYRRASQQKAATYVRAGSLATD
jgi:hypothetical protein